MKELEQKLELERSSARRHESQIHRLRNQLDRLQGEKSEDVSHKNNDALNRAQKQIRELRAEVQESERKEQETSKKRRNAVSFFRACIQWNHPPRKGNNLSTKDTIGDPKYSSVPQKRGQQQNDSMCPIIILYSDTY